MALVASSVDGVPMTLCAGPGGRCGDAGAQQGACPGAIVPFPPLFPAFLQLSLHLR